MVIENHLSGVRNLFYKIVLRRSEKENANAVVKNKIVSEVYLDIAGCYTFKTAITYVFVFSFGTVITYACLLFLILQ